MTNKNLYFQIDELDKYGITALYTTKEYGNVMEISKDKFIQDFSLAGKKIISGHQTHSDNIAVVRDETNLYFENTDGFITDNKNLVIFTKYADCLPIYIYDKSKNIIGVFHSGWQGTYKEIGIKGINIMKEIFNSENDDIIVAFGIGISKERYEVGEEFFNKFKEKFDENILNESFIRENGKLFFDNQKFNYLNFIKNGIKKENIITNSLCTYDGNFHSYRRDREKSGRNGAFFYFK